LGISGFISQCQNEDCQVEITVSRQFHVILPPPFVYPATQKNSSHWNTRKTLIEKIAANSEADWHDFHRQYQPFVTSIAYRAGVASADLGDVSQTIFLEVHRDLTKPEPPNFRERSFGSWLGQKVKWRVGEYHRHRYRREFATDPSEMPPMESDLPFDEIWEKDWNQKVLERALQRVSEKPRNLLIFQALAIQEMPVEEVCECFGISRSNADTIKKRVKDMLAPIVAEIEAGEI
jgi:RNA polymerase sigma-70 factor (ECF subfamily)